MFIVKCNNYEGTSVTVIQYLGLVILDYTDYFATWHIPGHSDTKVKYMYSEIIKHSLNHDFEICDMKTMLLITGT